MSEPTIYECIVCGRLYTNKGGWRTHERACVFEAGRIKVAALKKKDSHAKNKSESVAARMSRFCDNRRPFGQPDTGFVTDVILQSCAVKRNVGYGQLFTFVFCNLDYPQNIHWIHVKENAYYTVVVDDANEYKIRPTLDVIHDCLMILNGLISDFYARRHPSLDDAGDREFHMSTMRERIPKKMFYNTFTPATMIRVQMFEFYMIHLRNVYKGQEAFQEKVRECAAKALPDVI